MPLVFPQAPTDKEIKEWSTTKSFRCKRYNEKEAPMSKRELTEIEQLRHENHRLRNEAESYKTSRDNAFTLIEHLEQRVNDKSRIKALEQLCRDMYHAEYPPSLMDFADRMEQLGLIEGGE